MVFPEQFKSRQIIFDTFDADPSELDDEDDLNEQNLDSEAHRMMMAWDRGNLLTDAEGVSRTSPQDVDFTEYYDGEKSFDELKQEMEPLEGNLVWLKKIVANPEGEEILANKTVLFDCIGFLEYESEPFESSIHSGKPRLLNLACGELIPGLLMGLISLRKGERANVLMHPAMAYKACGAYPLIPPAAHLLYSIKVHQVWSDGDFDGFLNWERENLELIPLEEKIRLSIEHKNAANQYLNDDKPKEALVRYKAAIKWLSESSDAETSNSLECIQLLSILWQNVSITLNKLGMYKSATKAARQSLCINPRNIKAVYQLAKARIALGDHSRALLVLERGEKISPKNPDLLRLKSQIDFVLRDEKQKRDEIMVKMSKWCI